MPAASTTPPKNVKYDQKSGVNSVTDYVTLHGGLPPKKSVESIEKEAQPKKAPNSVLK